MYRNFKVVAITCFGRTRYTDLLTAYTRSCPLIDRHELWINTENPEDLASADRYCADLPDFFRKIISPASYRDHSSHGRLATFYKDFTASPNTLFIRLDDDIVWMAKDSIKRLLDFRIDNPHFFLVYANTLNNSLCTHLHQRFGAIPPEPSMEYSCDGDHSWKQWETAATVHSKFFETRDKDPSLRNFLFPDWLLLDFERCSINCMSWFGADNDLMREFMGADEEQSLSVDIPRRLGRPNCIVGQSLVAHFAYFTQREELESNTEWLRHYQRIAPYL
ncbi:MAG: hypothetical protein ABIS50_03635 [Luteolibacter sp.]|uniref:hypothetical protein n=1 Tax=Luteolibacter sp. TaxID=1962973 RepID=UPI00326567EA